MKQTIQNIIKIGDLKESQVFAFFTARLNVFGLDNIEKIQEETTRYAKTLAQSFVADNNEFFNEKQNKIAINKHIDNIKKTITKRHRFWEQVASHLTTNEKKETRENETTP